MNEKIIWYVIKEEDTYTTYIYKATDNYKKAKEWYEELKKCDPNGYYRICSHF